MACPAPPGRVVTLLPQPEETCWGMLYDVHDADRESVLSRLDHREKGGYERHDVIAVDTDQTRHTALVYVATPKNDEYLGPAPLNAIARQVLGSRGPSGENRDYVLELDRVLRELGALDPHVHELAALVRAGT